jgi:CubicO group peptidase (beta-lactamase class C family)
MAIKSTILLLLLLCATITFSQNRQTDLNKFFSTLSDNKQFNGNVLVAEDGKVIYEKSFGYADFANKILNTKRSTFPIASITKTFTATAILQLSEKNKLNLKDFVVKYLPEFPYPDITITHLLSHSSGLQPYDNFFDSLRQKIPDTNFTNRDILSRYALLKLSLFYQPGDNCNYDNVNYIFLALIIEKTSGMPYHDYVSKFIFQPAGMTNTFFPRVIFYHYTSKEKIKLSNTYRYPHLYSDALEKTDTIQFLSKYWNTYNFEGFGEIVSTCEDLLKYDQAFYDGKLLNPSTMETAFTPILLNNGKINNGNNNGTSFGLGWIIEADSSFGKIVRGSGGAIGLRASLFRNITKHQTIIIIDNTENESDNIARDVLKIMNGHTVKPYGKSMAKEFGKVLVTHGIEPAKKLLETIKTDSPDYLFNENEFNNLGYDLMSNNMRNEALETFKINTRLFPASWNVYDSYGEALLKYGQKEEAIKMYKKSVELNPANQNGKNVLEQILK